MRYAELGRSRRLGSICFLFFILLTLSSLHAANVTLKVRVGNPRDVDQKAQVRQNLPQRISTNDIMDLGGLDLGYDVKGECYYVFKEVTLGPKETREINVVLKDIWVIPPEEMDSVKKRAGDLAALLKNTDRFAGADALRQEVEKNTDVVRGNQDANAIQPGVKVVQHISAYEANLLAMERIRQAVGEMENMVLGAGMDPGELVGSIKDAMPPNRNVVLAEDQYRTLVYRITVQNPSPTASRPIPVNKELPAEITIDDILDPGGLELKADPKTGVVTVSTNNLELGPNQSRTFQIKLRDKWNVSFQRIANLKGVSSNLLDRISVKERFGTIETLIRNLMADLDRIEQEPVPKELNAQYVAFFRDQANRLDLIEAKINRISAALRPIEKTSKMGFNAKPPSMKTTWMIIYIILGFLAFMSLLFFFRWYGGSKVDRMQEGSEPPSAKK